MQFCFVHRLPGYRYEVECDEHSMSAAAQRSLDITGRVRGNVRFHTPQIKELLVQLDQLEQKERGMEASVRLGHKTLRTWM